jgi:hypothetical protein
MANKLGAITVLKRFFGQKPGQSIGEFSEEVKQLDSKDKHELATLAAAELGVELKEEATPVVAT